MGKRALRFDQKIILGVALCCLSGLSASCILPGKKASEVVYPGGKSFDDGQRTKVAGRNYVYNLPHAVPSDYVYRTERVFPPPKGSAWSWWPFSGGANGRGKNDRQITGTDQQAVRFVAAARSLVEQLMRSGSTYFEEEYRFTVSSFVNLNDLYRTSAFGRVLGEQMVTELRNSGLEIVDVRKTPNILIRKKFGEYGISRDMEELPYIHEAHATVVGTYSVAADQVFVNVRLLRNSDGYVIASGSEVLRKDNLVASLLEDESAPVEKNLHTVQIDVQ